MCGRFVSTAPPRMLAERFDADEVEPDGVPPSWNVAPTAQVHAVTRSSTHGTRRVEALRWGLVPSWAKDPSVGSRMINARAESLQSKPAFRSALAKHRCIIPADGFYEWGPPTRRTTWADAAPKKGRARRGPRQPYFIHREDGDLLAMAGLWSPWKDVEGKWMRTCTIITTGATDDLAKVHGRMPVVLPETSWAQWLDSDVLDVEETMALLSPAADQALVMRPVSPLVNNVRNDSADLIDPVSPE